MFVVFVEVFDDVVVFVVFVEVFDDVVVFVVFVEVFDVVVFDVVVFVVFVFVFDSSSSSSKAANIFASYSGSMSSEQFSTFRLHSSISATIAPSKSALNMASLGNPYR